MAGEERVGKAGLCHLGLPGAPGEAANAFCLKACSGGLNYGL